jgi:hypothetical protein
MVFSFLTYHSLPVSYHIIFISYCTEAPAEELSLLVALKIAPQEVTYGDFQKCLEQLHTWRQKYIVAERQHIEENHA